MPKTAKRIVKSASLEKTINNALAALSAAHANGEAAVAAVSKVSKKLLT